MFKKQSIYLVHILCYWASVNTYTSVMVLSTEVKNLMTCLRQNKKYGVKRLLTIMS